jgi:hypothetical protein
MKMASLKMLIFGGLGEISKRENGVKYRRRNQWLGVMKKAGEESPLLSAIWRNGSMASWRSCINGWRMKTLPYKCSASANGSKAIESWRRV